MFQIPSLTDLSTRARSAFRTYLRGSDAWLKQNNISVSAKVIAGVAYEVFGFADYIAQQIFVTTADSESLDKHGAEYGMARRPAGPGYGSLLLTSTDAASVAAGGVLRRTDGVEYLALSAAAISGAGSFSVDVVAAVDGEAGNASAGTSLEAVSGVTGPVEIEVAAGGVAGGTAVEGDESFRARILFRKRNPPHGGAPADYVQWATDVSGVTRAFVERRWNGTGTVRLFVLMDNLYANGIAPVGEIERVAEYIDGVAPAGAIVTVAAPVAKIIDVQISGISPDTTSVREAALDELRDAFARHSRVAGIDTGGMSFLAKPATFSRSWLWQAVANAAAEERHSINLPVVDISLNPGEVPVLGTVTFIP